MKIVVLAGGLSTERQVSLTSGTGVCRALRERGHQAILVDMFLGLEDYNGSLADIFDAPDGLCGDNRVTEEAPDLEAVRRSRKDQGPSLLGKDVLSDDLPYVTGSIGLLGSRPSYEMMRDCDTLLVVGSNFPYSQFLPKFGQARAIQIDIDGTAIGMRYPTEVNIVADAGAALSASTTGHVHGKLVVVP